MSEATADRVSRFISHEMAKQGRRMALLKFYGGEPLLRSDICSRIARQTHEWCQSHNKTLKTWVQTNGTVYPPTWLDEPLPGLCCVEITIDGDKQTHNRVRTNAQHVPTYDTIVKNICDLASRRIPVSLRINAHSTNELRNALEDLGRHGVFKHDYVSFYDGQVSQSFFKDKFKGTCYGHACGEGHIQLVESLRHEIKTLGLSHKYQAYPMFRTRMGVCSFSMSGNYSIDPEGGLYSCVFRQSEPAHLVGHITDNGAPVFNESYQQILNRSPFAYKECVQCALLPQCWGGCLARAHDVEKGFNQSCCGNLPSMLHDMLAAYIRENFDHETVSV